MYRTTQLALERRFVEGVQAHVVDGATVADQPMVIASGRAQIRRPHPGLT